MTKRKSYSKEFKQQAVEMLLQRDRPAIDIARELGIRQNMLYKWREEILQKGDGEAFKGPGRPTADKASEVSRLKQENKRLKEELEILKKAAAYFAKELP